MRARKGTAARGEGGGGKKSSADRNKSLGQNAADVQPLVSAPKEALAFLALLDPEADSFTFQTFDDKGEDGKLARVFHGPLAEHAAILGTLNWRGAGVFVTVNETDGAGRKTENITRVRAVFADLDGAPLDPVKKGELKPHLIVESSTGRWHAYWRLNGLPLDAFEDVQRGIADRFGGDTAVTDLPRVMRLPGYMHLKGEPFTMRILESRDAPPYSAADVRAAFPPPADRQEADDGPILEGKRNETLYKLACAWRRNGAGYDEILADLRAVNEARCQLPLNDADLPQIAKSAYRHDPAPNLTEAGNGVRFAKQHGDRVKFCVPDETWLIFGHGRWKTDEAHRVNRLAVRTAMSYRRDAKRADARGKEGRDDAKAYRAWVKTSLRDRALQAMLRQSRDLLAVHATDLDANGWLLNFRNGTYNLKDHYWRSFDPLDLITMRLTYKYDPKGRCPEFDKFLDTALAGDKAMISFLWRCVGYSLTGETDEQVAFLLQGPTRSGKTTMLEVLQAVVGEYGWAAEGRTLEGGRRTGVGDDIVLLRGKRVVIFDEVPEDIGLNESFLKRVISGGTLSGRALWSKGINFEATAKVWLGSNRLPIRGLDPAIWRRLVFIPLEVQVPENRIDRKLRQRLMRERAGIMNRALAGLRDYQKRGLKIPARSTQALAAYRLERDSMGRFFQECCVIKPGACVSFRELFQKYECWAAEEIGRRVMTETAFGRELGRRGYVSARVTVNGKEKSFRRGLALIDDKDAF